MKVYILTSDFGQYEDSRIQIEGIFLNLAKAEEVKSEIISCMKKYIETECPFGDDELDNLSPEQEEECIEWSSNYYHALDFNYCSIEEYDVIE